MFGDHEEKTQRSDIKINLGAQLANDWHENSAFFFFAVLENYLGCLFKCKLLGYIPMPADSLGLVGRPRKLHLTIIPVILNRKLEDHH